MASELARSISNYLTGEPDNAYLVDQELQEVRDVLAGLRLQYLPDCWCDAGHEDDHKDSCIRARALLKKLEIK